MNDKIQKVIDKNIIVLNPLDPHDRTGIRKISFENGEIKRTKSIPRKYEEEKISLTANADLVQYGTYYGSVERTVTNANPKPAIKVCVHTNK